MTACPRCTRLTVHLVLGLLALASSSCSVAAGFPSVHAETTQARCLNGVDDDLNGRLDCAEATCAPFCPTADRVHPADLTPCYTLGDSAFVFVRGESNPDGECLPWSLGSDGELAEPVCQEGEQVFAGEANCTPLGATCKAPGEWPSDVPAGAIYVLSEAAAGGDGSVGAPYANLSDAITHASDGDTIMIGPGLYLGEVRVEHAVTLRGVCADAVHLWSDGSDPVLTVAASGVSVVDVTIGVGLGSTHASVERGLRIEAANARLDSVAIDGVQRSALEVATGGELLGHRLSVRGQTPAADPAILLEEGSTTAIQQLRVDSVEGDGIEARGSLNLSGAYLADLTGGAGLSVHPSADVTLAGVAIVRPTTAAIDADCSGDPLPCVQGEDVMASADGALGIVVRGGSVAFTRTLLLRAGAAGVHLLSGVGQFDDLVVKQTSAAGGVTGAGVRIEAGASLRGSRLLMQQNLLDGVEVRGGDLLVSHLTVDARQRSGTNGVGVRAVGGSLALQAFAIDQAGVCAIELFDGANAVFRDGVVSGSGRGICVRDDDITVEEMAPFVTFTEDVARPIFVE